MARETQISTCSMHCCKIQSVRALCLRSWGCWRTTMRRFVSCLMGPPFGNHAHAHTVAGRLQPAHRARRPCASFMLVKALGRLHRDPPVHQPAREAGDTQSFRGLVAARVQFLRCWKAFETHTQYLDTHPVCESKVTAEY
mmetsp:Transcript_12281/g.33143  ORF Transcript_12281/g.33143 Transcript_12281/m.33143 type:complete len:140 (+) Transcript_12281:1246-1665(+)